MEIHIKGHETIGGLLKERDREFDVVLYTNSQIAPGDQNWPGHVVEKHCKEFIHMPIDDMDFVRKNYVIPSVESVKKVLDWSAGRDKLICCCHAGISRSSSTAYLIASREWGPKAALSILKPHKHWPNRLIVYFGSQVLNDPTIWQTFVDWQLKETGLDPSRNGDWPLAIASK